MRQRLKGPALAAYYPRKMATIKDLNKAYAPMGLETLDEEEDDRLEHIRMYASASIISIGTSTNAFAVLKQEGREHQRRSGHRTVWTEAQEFADGC